MPFHGKKSEKNLSMADPVLKIIFKEVIKSVDHSILNSYRDEKSQNDAFKSGLSKLKYPNSLHNTMPSLAVDAAPYPIDWNDLDRFRFFGGFVLGVAEYLFNNGIIEYKIRWGGDWNRDFQVKDNNFNDLVHFEMMPRK